MTEEIGNIESLVASLKDRQILLVPNRYKPRRAGKRYRGRSKLSAREALERLRESRRKDRRAQNDTLKGSFYYLKKTYRWRNRKRQEKGNKPVVFNLSFEEYKALWQAAGMVQDGNRRVWAFRLRGKGLEKARLMRIDQDGPFELNNCVIMWRGLVLANGRKLEAERQETA